MSRDGINHPQHYNQGKYEVIDVIEDWKLNFHLGNVVKYVARAEHKGAREEDTKKALWYLKRHMANERFEDCCVKARQDEHDRWIHAIRSFQTDTGVASEDTNQLLENIITAMRKLG